MPECRVVSRRGTEFSVRAVETEARAPVCAGLRELPDHVNSIGRRRVLRPGERVAQAHLERYLAPRKLQRCRVREFPCCPLCLEIRDQVRLNRVEVRKLRAADVAGFRDMIAHPAGELHALLLEVVEKPFDALRRLADLRACQHACGGVCHDELQFFHSCALGAPDENRHLAKILASFRNQRPNRSRAAVPGDEAVLAVFPARDRRRVHNAGQRNGVFKVFEFIFVDRVKVRVVANKIVNVDLHELTAGVRLGHRLHLLGKNA